MSWTDERIETLTKMWEGGATASQIASAIQRSPAFSALLSWNTWRSR